MYPFYMKWEKVTKQSVLCDPLFINKILECIEKKSLSLYIYIHEFKKFLIEVEFLYMLQVYQTVIHNF